MNILGAIDPFEKKSYRFVGVINHKGGVGKTFIASHLIWGLRDFFSKSVCGIDMDSQMDLFRWVGGKDWQGQDRLELRDILLLSGYGKTTVAVPNDCSFIIMDSRPSVESFPDLLKRLDFIFIPVDGRLSIESTLDLKYLMKELGIEDKSFVIRNKVSGEDTALQKREERLIAGLNGEVLSGGILDTKLVRVSEYYRIPVWKIKGSGYQRTGIIPFVKMMCEKITGESLNG